MDSNHEANSDNIVESYDLMMGFDFFDSFYFMMTTISVVGYGSSVSSLKGKMALIVIIIIMILN